MKKILFLTHDASRTGAPHVLLYLLQWIKTNQPHIKVSVLALKGGQLSDEFTKVSDVYFELPTLVKIKPNILRQLYQKLSRNLKVFDLMASEEENLYQDLAKENFDVIFSNTVVTVPIGEKIKSLGSRAKFVAYVHELNSVIETLVPDFRKFSPKVDFFFSASEMVTINLKKKYMIPQEIIATVYEFTTLKKVEKKSSQDSFIVGGAGWVYWRKGPDIFIQIARIIKFKYPNSKVKFIWVGTLKDDQKIIIENDIRKCGLVDMVSFIGEKKNPENDFINFDVFLMTSREDPFPLVCIEVAMMAKPIICFEGATGTAELLKNGGGEVVPYLDIEAMAAKLMNYYNDRELLCEDGIVAKNLFSNFTPEKIAPVIFHHLLELQNKN